MYCIRAASIIEVSVFRISRLISDHGVWSVTLQGHKAPFKFRLVDYKTLKHAMI